MARKRAGASRQMGRCGTRGLCGWHGFVLSGQPLLSHVGQNKEAHRPLRWHHVLPLPGPESLPCVALSPWAYPRSLTARVDVGASVRTGGALVQAGCLSSLARKGVKAFGILLPCSVLPHLTPLQPRSSGKMRRTSFPPTLRQLPDMSQPRV